MKFDLQTQNRQFCWIWKLEDLRLRNMSEEKFNLKWNEFESHIGTSFKELRDENDLFDVWLNCEDGEMAAHKLVLSSCSSVLKKLLRRRQTPGGGCGGHIGRMLRQSSTGAGAFGNAIFGALSSRGPQPAHRKQGAIEMRKLPPPGTEFVRSQSPPRLRGAQSL